MIATSTADAQAAIEREFDVFSARAEIVVPPELRAQMLDDFRDLHRMTKVIRNYLKQQDMPAETFLLSSATRSL